MARPFRVGYDTVDCASASNNGTFSQHVNSLKELSWYVGELARDKAESLLFKDCVPGTYLLRKSPRHDEYAMSVRTFDSINHFVVKYNPFDMKYTFGPEEFSSLSGFVGFFESCPLVKYNDGDKVVKLNAPFKNDKQTNGTKTQSEMSPYEIAMNESKEGYLIKRGAVHKNWKERWFVVRGDVVKYFNRRLDDKPLREMSLSEAIEIKESDVDDKRNCFSLEFPWRTFYFVAKCSDEKKSWMGFFQARINFIKEDVEECAKSFTT